MNSREKILQDIDAIAMGKIPLPVFVMPSEQSGSTNLVSLFKEKVQAAGGIAHESATIKELNEFIKEIVDKGTLLINAVRHTVHYNIEEYIHLESKELEAVHTVILTALMGVAENGALWLTDKEMGNPVLPFICEELVLVVRKTDIVSNMHEAYVKMEEEHHSFGVFIAGPSKTADIEQSLVIGAHGAKTFHVFIISNE